MKHTEQDALEILARNKVKVYPEDKLIHVKNVGIKLWGVIDYLKNHCKYKVVKEK